MVILSGVRVFRRLKVKWYQKGRVPIKWDWWSCKKRKSSFPPPLFVCMCTSQGEAIEDTVLLQRSRGLHSRNWVVGTWPMTSQSSELWEFVVKYTVWYFVMAEILVKLDGLWGCCSNKYLKNVTVLELGNVQTGGI